MANKKLNQLVTKPSIASGDLFPIADATTGQLYKTTISDLGTAIGSGVSSVNGLVGAVVLDTDDIQELASPVNKWFTDLRARAAISAGTGISYSSSTGVIASTITQYTDALARAAVSLTTTGSNGSATYNSTTGVLNVPTYTLSGLGGQPLATNLTALAGLSYSSLGFLKMTGVGTFALDTNTYALDSAVVHNTGNETIAGQKTFSSTIYGAGAVFSAAMVAQSINITGITASPSVYITTNGTNHAVSIVQSGTGYAIYASGNVAVIGTGYFSSSLTASSLSSTAGYNYTLPSASGTLALTSDLSSYLPLNGGTLTGSLNGTSATFSGRVTGNGGISSKGGYATFEYNSSATGPTYPAYNTYYGAIGTNFSNGGSELDIWNTVGGGFVFRKQTGASAQSALLTIASSGAATFSSNVTASSFFQANDGTRNVYLNPGADFGSGFLPTIQVVSNHALQFATNNSLRMIITNGGNVGIGTLNPQGGAGSTDRTLSINSGSGAASFVTGLVGDVKYSTLFTSSSQFTIETNASIPITFNTNSSERMRITSGGAVCIGTTSPATGSKLTVTGGDINLTNGIVYANGVSAGLSTQNREGSNLYIWIGYNAGMKLYNDALGFIGTFAASTGIYTPTSDINKKKDFELSNIGLNEVLQLKPTFYRMKSDNSQGMKELGFLAQEVKEVIPNAYVENEGFIGLNFNPIVAALTKAVQELKAELDTYTGKNK